MGFVVIVVCLFVGVGNKCLFDFIDFMIFCVVMMFNDFKVLEVIEVFGDFVVGGLLWGVMNVVFVGSDVGGGLYCVVVIVDGVDVVVGSVLDLFGWCVVVDFKDGYVFKWL